MISIDFIGFITQEKVSKNHFILSYVIKIYCILSKKHYDKKQGDENI